MPRDLIDRNLKRASDKDATALEEQLVEVRSCHLPSLPVALRLSYAGVNNDRPPSVLTQLLSRFSSIPHW